MQLLIFFPLNFLAHTMMKKTVVSQGLAYQQPTDDGGHERPPMLFNDGREMPTFRQSDQSALGKLQRHFFSMFFSNYIYYT